MAKIDARPAKLKKNPATVMADYKSAAGRFTMLVRSVVFGNPPAFGFAIIRRQAYDNSLTLTLS